MSLDLHIVGVKENEKTLRETGNSMLNRKQGNNLLRSFEQE